MNEHEFQSKLAELMGEISTLPHSERQKLEKLADETLRPARATSPNRQQPPGKPRLPSVEHQVSRVRFGSDPAGEFVSEEDAGGDDRRWLARLNIGLARLNMGLARLKIPKEARCAIQPRPLARRAGAAKHEAGRACGLLHPRYGGGAV